MKNIFLKIFSYWMVFVKLLGKFNTFILLTLVYFILIGPLAIFFKLIRKDLLNIKFPDSKESFWAEKQRKMLERRDYEQQF